jgi:hypothetical protein
MRKWVIANINGDTASDTSHVLNPTFPDSRPIECDFASLEALRQKNSIAIGPLAGKMTGHLGLQRSG